MSDHITTKESVEQARINRWRDKQAQDNPGFLYEHSTQDNAGKKVITLYTDLDKKNISQAQQAELFSATLYAITGSTSPEYGRLLFAQMLAGQFGSEDGSAFANAINGALLSMAPADITEGHLCARLMVLNNQILEYLARAASPTQTVEGRDLNLNRAVKLTRVYNESLDALNKYRRKGEQRVVVQYVNVNNGGQAIVADQVHTGDNRKK